MKERQLLFKAGANQLFGMLFEPYPAAGSPMAYVICQPFAEEKKSAQKVLVDLARGLQQKGAYVLLFDHSGTGESEGQLKNASLSRWVDETTTAIHWLKENYLVTDIGLVGLRLGAYIAMQAANRVPQVKSLGLIEPVLHPEKYLKTELRSKLMKELITHGAVSKSREELIEEVKNDQSIDFDGHEISTSFYLDLALQPKLAEVISSATDASIHLININTNGRLARSYSQLQKALNSSGTDLNCQQVAFETFWYRTGPLDTRVFVNQVTRILETESALIEQ